MNRVLLLVLLISVCAWSSAANPKELDAKEAIIGAWVVDAEFLLSKISDEQDKHKQRMLAKTLSAYSRNIIEFKKENIVASDVTQSGKLSIMAMDTDDGLWLVGDQDNDVYFNSIQLTTKNRFVATPGPHEDALVQAEFYRVFPQGMLERENKDHKSASGLVGLWMIDYERLNKMPWVVSINDLKMREQFVESFKSRAPFEAIGFKDGVVYVKTVGEVTPTRLTDYSVKAAEEKTLAISIRAFQPRAAKLFSEPAKKWPLSRVDFLDDNHMEILWTAVAPGPIPMTRYTDVALP